MAGQQLLGRRARPPARPRAPRRPGRRPGCPTARVGPVDEHHAVAGEQHVVGAHVAVDQRRARARRRPARLQFGQPVQVLARPRVAARRGAVQGGQLRPAAEELPRILGQRAPASAAGLGVRSLVQGGSARRDRVELAASQGCRGGPPVDRLEGERHPVAVVVGVEQARERAAPRAARPRPPPRAGACPASRGSARPDRLDEDGAARATPSTAVAPGENPPARSRTAAGAPPPTPAAHVLHRRRAPRPRAGGRRPPDRSVSSRGGGPGSGQRLVDALDQSARRLRAELHGDAGAGPAGRVGEVDVERVVERRVERMVEVDAGRGDAEPALRPLGAAGDRRWRR